VFDVCCDYVKVCRFLFVLFCKVVNGSEDCEVVAFGSASCEDEFVEFAV